LPEPQDDDAESTAAAVHPRSRSRLEDEVRAPGSCFGAHTVEAPGTGVDPCPARSTAPALRRPCYRG